MITVACIGRTNVGKSTLFNKIVGGARAMTSELPHTTRDRVVGKTVWRGVTIRCIDTGGVEMLGGRAERPDAKTIEGEIRAQAAMAAKDADILLLVVDSRAGILAGERAISTYLRKLGKPIVIAWNKAETMKLRSAVLDASVLGFGEALAVSAVTGSGVGDLLDRLVAGAELDAEPVAVEGTPQTPITLTLVGEPNVGKSSILNAILGREEAIVLPEPFTTRDVHDVTFQVGSTPVTILDTAGVRRVAMRAIKNSRSTLQSIERTAVTRSIHAIRRADVAVLVLDAMRPATQHTRKLATAIVEDRRACVIVVNKIDAMPSGVGVEDRVRELFPHLGFAPVLLTSATKGTNITTILPSAIRASAAWHRELTQDEIIRAYTIVKRRIPIAKTSFARRRSHIVELLQTGTTPPAFMLRTLARVKIPYAIPQIVDHVLRATFDFAGTPIRVITKSIKN